MRILLVSSLVKMPRLSSPHVLRRYWNWCPQCQWVGLCILSFWADEVSECCCRDGTRQMVAQNKRGERERRACAGLGINEKVEEENASVVFRIDDGCVPRAWTALPGSVECGPNSVNFFLRSTEDRRNGRIRQRIQQTKVPPRCHNSVMVKCSLGSINHRLDDSVRRIRRTFSLVHLSFSGNVASSNVTQLSISLSLSVCVYGCSSSRFSLRCDSALIMASSSSMSINVIPFGRSDPSSVSGDLVMGGMPWRPSSFAMASRSRGMVMC